MTGQSEETLFGPPLPTAKEAAEAGRMGHNLRCNRCGLYGGTWVPDARPGWGALALCHPEREEYEQMLLRHRNERSFYTTVHFEQDR